MNITIYIDADGKVVITDLPTELLPMVHQLNDHHTEYQCNGITGYAIDDIYKILK